MISRILPLLFLFVLVCVLSSGCTAVYVATPQMAREANDLDWTILNPPRDDQPQPQPDTSAPDPATDAPAIERDELEEKRS